MKIKTDSLADDALDWAVATREGYTLTSDGISNLLDSGKDLRILGPSNSPLSFSPSTNWSHGGPIAESKKISAVYDEDRDVWVAVRKCSLNDAMGFNGENWSEGPTELIAKMRCHVLTELGPEVDVPEVLIEKPRKAMRLGR